MQQQIIKCAFCRGTGVNPHFRGTCPVCKGLRKNEMAGKYITCQDCAGTGQKRGTTLTCYSCGGLGVLPDTRQEFKKARKEIKEAQEEIEKEAGRSSIKTSQKAPPDDSLPNSCFCQSCAHKIKKDSIIKVCLSCFHKIKGLAPEH